MLPIPPEDTLATQAVDLVRSLLVLGGGALVALVLLLLLTRLLFRIERTDRFAQEASEKARWPARATVALVGMLVALPAAELPATLAWPQRLLTVTTIAAAAWWAVRLGVAVEATILSSLDLDGDVVTPSARRRQTQVQLLRRVITAVLVIVAAGAILLTFDEARSLGTSLLASAGILGLVAGIAAQATLGNLIAGIQIAVAEPIKLDDVVVVEGEWGNIEEITLTYVVVRTWDRRRLVLPTSYFVRTPFTNWTRDSSQVIGSVFWHLDHRTPVDAVRHEFHRLVDDNPRWDGDIASLQVTDTTDTTIEVRGVITGADSTAVWNLRCELREGIIAFLRDHHPESLPALRVMEAPAIQMRRRPTLEPPREPGPGPDTQPSPDPTRTMRLPAQRPPRR